MSANTRLINRCLSCILLIRSDIVSWRPSCVGGKAFSRSTQSTLVCPSVLGIPALKPPLLWNSNRKYPPMPSEFQLKDPPLPSEILKAVRGIGMDIFWNCPLRQSEVQILLKPVNFFQASLIFNCLNLLQ